MRKIIILFILALFIVGCSVGSSGGGGGGGDDSTEVSANSMDGATDVGVDSSFVDAFDNAITESSVTTNSYFIVQTPPVAQVVGKAAIDTSTCIAANAIESTVETTSTTATLTPSSNLSAGTGYTFCLTTDVQYADASSFLIRNAYAASSFEGFSASFTTAGTASGISVASMTKSSNISMTVGSGSVDLTFTFESDASGTSPLVSVTDSTGTAMTTSCDFQSGSNTVYVCTV